MSPVDRELELMGAYSINENLNLNLNGSNVLIIDDVITTGTTLKTISTVLRERWPEIKISVFCLARAMRYRRDVNLCLNGDVYFTDV